MDSPVGIAPQLVLPPVAPIATVPPPVIGFAAIIQEFEEAVPVAPAVIKPPATLSLPKPAAPVLPAKARPLPRTAEEQTPREPPPVAIPIAAPVLTAVPIVLPALSTDETRPSQPATPAAAPHPESRPEAPPQVPDVVFELAIRTDGQVPEPSPAPPLPPAPPAVCGDNEQPVTRVPQAAKPVTAERAPSPIAELKPQTHANKEHPAVASNQQTTPANPDNPSAQDQGDAERRSSKEREPLRPRPEPPADIASPPVQGNTPTMATPHVSASALTAENQRVPATPVKSQAAPPPATASHLVEAPGEPGRPQQPLRSVSLEFTPDGAQDIRLRLSERAGEVHLSLHSNDAVLTGHLRDGIQDLVGSLSNAGYDAEAWTPDQGRQSQQHQPEDQQQKQEPAGDEEFGNFLRYQDQENL